MLMYHTVSTQKKKKLKNVKRKERKIPNRKDVILTVETCFLGISTFIPYARALKYIHELSTFFDGVGFLKNLLFLENI